jgi:hypothetical protein
VDLFPIDLFLFRIGNIKYVQVFFINYFIQPHSFGGLLFTFSHFFASHVILVSVIQSAYLFILNHGDTFALYLSQF